MFPDPDMPELPFSEEEVRGLVERLDDDHRKIGLYMQSAGFHIDQVLEDDVPEHKLVLVFNIGDVAFSPRVQDPVQDVINDQFREIAVGSLEDDIEDIKRRYQKDNEKNEE